MTEQDLSKLSESDLVEKYVDLGLAASAADDLLDTDRSNRLGRKMAGAVAELKRRGPMSVRALQPLMKHDNECVRMNAAQDCHEFAPGEARAVLEELSAHGDVPYRFLADATLHLYGYTSRLFAGMKPFKLPRNRR